MKTTMMPSKDIKTRDLFSTLKDENSKEAKCHHFKMFSSAFPNYLNKERFQHSKDLKKLKLDNKQATNPTLVS